MSKLDWNTVDSTISDIDVGVLEDIKKQTVCTRSFHRIKKVLGREDVNISDMINGIADTIINREIKEKNYGSAGVG